MQPFHDQYALRSPPKPPLSYMLYRAATKGSGFLKPFPTSRSLKVTANGK